MPERRKVEHLGWTCTTRSCVAFTDWTPTGNLDQDRKDSQASAESAGWAFIPQTDSRGRPLQGLPVAYCSRCAPVAQARADLRRTQVLARGWKP